MSLFTRDHAGTGLPTILVTESSVTLHLSRFLPSLRLTMVTVPSVTPESGSENT